jgi:hypothetical protein
VEINNSNENDSSKRLSLLDSAEVHEPFSIPEFNDEDRSHFFGFSDDEIRKAKRLRSNFNSEHFLLLLGYFKAKTVCLVFTWKEIKKDLLYIYDRYFTEEA